MISYKKRSSRSIYPKRIACLLSASMDAGPISHSSEAEDSPLYTQVPNSLSSVPRNPNLLLIGPSAKRPPRITYTTHTYHPQASRSSLASRISSSNTGLPTSNHKKKRPRKHIKYSLNLGHLYHKIESSSEFQAIAAAKYAIPDTTPQPQTLLDSLTAPSLPPQLVPN